MILLASLALSGILGGGPGPLVNRVAAIAPSLSEEKWLAIPWRLDLGQARVEAQKSGKPLFLWIMNGHPLGCT